MYNPHRASLKKMLKIENLHAKAGDKEILKGVSLTIRDGEIHALMGTNGAGKSTLSNVIVGNPAYEVTEGSITFNGQDLLAMSPEERADLLDREIELLRMIDQKDTEIRAQEQEAVQIANEKDSEKRMFNWKALGSASAVVLAAVGVGAAVLGGKFDIKLPSKK